MKSIRNAVVAGQFYPGTKDQLIKEIENCFSKSKIELNVPPSKTNKKYGAVVPHAGYSFSGKVAAGTYAELMRKGLPDILVILGPNHSGLGSGIATVREGIWETPLGRIRIDQEFADLICRGLIDCDPTAHLYEHSIEVQLPFLQYIYSKTGKQFSFVPLSMGIQDAKASKSVGTIIAEAIKKLDREGKSAYVVASSDFSHVGISYMTQPPQGFSANKWAEAQDKKAIDKILELNPDGLIETVTKENITMCGYGPVSAMLWCLKSLGAKKARLVAYATSWEVMPGESCVGYGGIIVE
jgi:hypothetical protein